MQFIESTVSRITHIAPPVLTAGTVILLAAAIYDAFVKPLFGKGGNP